MWTTEWNTLYHNKPTAKPGMTSIQGDEWTSANPIIEGDELDVKYFDTNIRYERYDDIIPSLPVIVELTGKMVYCEGASRKMRCKITTWDNNEDPVSFLGWLWLFHDYNDNPL